jgi:Flp pilus assembly protein protease CpaA
MLELIGLAVALVGVAYSSYTDIKTGEVSDRLSHSMIGIGAIIVAFAYPFATAVWILAMAGVVFGLGFLMYIFGQMGGGDVKLFTALTLLVPYYPDSIRSFVASLGITPVASNYPFIVSVFILSGIFFMLVIPLFYLKKIFAKQAKIPEFRKKLVFGLVYCAILSPILYLWFGMSRYVTILFVPMFFALLIIPFKDDIVVLFFARKKKVANLNDDDVMALETMSKTTITKLGLWRKTFTPPEIKKIKERARKYKIATVMVCEDLPKYVPYIFLSLILNLLAGDVFLYLFSLG